MLTDITPKANAFASTFYFFAIHNAIAEKNKKSLQANAPDNADDEFWRGTEKDSVISGVMHPTDYNSLKDDKEYIYFLKTQLNLMGWIVEKPMLEATTNGTILKVLIENELEQLGK